MEKFKRTKRSSILFHLYGILTLGISSAVTLTRMQKEYALIRPDAANEKKLLPYPAVYFLGIVTLGIVPLVWRIRFASRVGELARAKEVKAPKLTGARFGWWATLGLLILIGPWYAFRLLFLNFNALLFAANEEIDVLSRAKEELDQGRPNVLLAEKESAEAEEEKEEAPVDELPAPRKTEDGLNALLEKYAACEEGRFAVRFSKGSRPIRTFAKKEDAVAFGKALSAMRHVGLRYVKLK